MCTMPRTPTRHGRIRRALPGSIAKLIGDVSPDRRYASTVTALMTGFGETVRTMGLFDGWDFDELVAHYGGIVQAQIDACTAAHS